MAGPRKAATKPRRAKPVTNTRRSPAGHGELYTLEVTLLRGPVSALFARRNPVVSRTVQVRSDQTLADLHGAIFAAYDRTEERPYEFQFGKGPMDPRGPRYVLPGFLPTPFDEINPPAGTVTETALGSLALEVGRTFAYWFDFTEDWWHQVRVAARRKGGPRGRFPRMTKRVGESPPQAPADEPAEEVVPRDIEGSVAADTACLIGELHLRKGDYAKAVEAFTRAIENSPTADAYDGRAKAHRALADEDERRAARLR